MASVNKVIIIGNLGQDPQVQQFQNGNKIATISVATTERWTDKNTGEHKEATEWHKVVFKNHLANIATQYLRKGSQVYVEGRLRTRKWTDGQGVERYTTEIKAVSMQMLGGGQQAPQPQNGYQQGYGQAPQGQQYAPRQWQPRQWQAPQGQQYATYPDGQPVFPPQPMQGGQWVGK